MKYVGSKNRIAKEILPFILKDRIDENHLYVEPFVGGGNMIDKVKGNRWGNDFFKPTVDALLLIRDFPELIPKNNNEFSEEDYKKMKFDKENKLHGFVGFNYSFGAKFWGGWRRSFLENGIMIDEIKQSYTSSIKQSPLLQNVKFTNLSYHEMDIPENSIIYCDPPYQETLSYSSGKFNHEEFWQWVREKSLTNRIFVSEYTAPKDFVSIWSKEISTNISSTRTEAKISVEHLFVHESQKPKTIEWDILI